MLRRRWRYLLAAVALLLLLVAVWLSGVADFFSLGALQTHYVGALALVAAQPLLAGGLYVLLFVVISLLALPVALYLAVAGGALFGLGWGFTLAMVGKLLASAVLFGLVRGLAGGRTIVMLEHRLGVRGAQLREAFAGNMFTALLVMRIVPVFPFFLVSVVPPLLGMRFGPFMLASALGLLPANLIYCLTGAGLAGTLAAGDTVTLEQVLTPEMWLGLLGLAGLAVLPRLLRGRLVSR